MLIDLHRDFHVQLLFSLFSCVFFFYLIFFFSEIAKVAIWFYPNLARKFNQIFAMLPADLHFTLLCFLKLCAFLCLKWNVNVESISWWYNCMMYLNCLSVKRVCALAPTIFWNCQSPLLLLTSCLHLNDNTHSTSSFSSWLEAYKQCKNSYVSAGKYRSL